MLDNKVLMLRLERERNARIEAENIAETKSLELYQANLELRDLLKCNQVRYEVALLLAKSTSLEKAVIQILNKICELMHFEFGAIWEPDPRKNELHCTHTCPIESTSLESFITITKNYSISIGIGLPGRTWESKNSVWIEDVTLDPNFPRFKEAKEANLHSACAFSVTDEEKILYVIEFYMQFVYPYREHLINMLNDVSKQIAVFIERRQFFQKIEIARFAGMSEVTTTILHNVGNVLNSVNTSVNLLREHWANPKSLGRLIGLSKIFNAQTANLGEFFTHDKNSKKIPEFLTLLVESLEEELKNSNKELDFLANNIKHIIDIISTQQILSTSTSLTEPTSIAEKTDEAINVVGFHTSVLIKREYKVTELILLDKIKLMQILINLLRNAKDALKTVKKGKKLIVLIDRNSHSTIRIQVIDNGGGISPEQASGLFTFGFTTKKDGHGFGLHSSILLAKEMGGTLSAANNQRGKGAVFTLELPYKVL